MSRKTASIVCAAAVAFAAGACGHGATAPPSDVEIQRARALLDPATALPLRAEAVALADAVSVAASKQGKTAAGGELVRLAADLRARIWRLDQAAADVREALELYANAAQLLAGTEGGCDADRARALLGSELAADGPAAYRELYLAMRRQAVVLRGGASACRVSIDRDLARVTAYKPSSDAMRALERDGDRAADAAQAGRIDAVAASGSAAVIAASAAGASSRSGSAAAGPADVVVSPKDDAVGKEPVKITSVERFAKDEGGRVVVNVSAPTTFHVGSLAADESSGKDERVFVDVARAASKGLPHEIEVGGAIRRVRVGAQADGTRIVLDLAGALYKRVFYLPDPFRIVVDVSTRPPIREEATTPEGKREVRRVAVDAGHGGGDDGAVGPTGLREKEVTLDIARTVASLLAHEVKVDTLLTRDSDAFVPLELRTARANAFHADLFVSVHCNASEDGVAHGFQTYVLDASHDSEGAAARVAARENGRARSADSQRVEAEMQTIFAGLNPAGDLAPRSHHFAELLQVAAASSLRPRYPDTRDQGVKTAGFYVLAGADMPAALFETAFISNPDEEKRLATADYRHKLADAIVNAVRAYREGK